jgi:hypothetical protein
MHVLCLWFCLVACLLDQSIRRDLDAKSLEKFKELFVETAEAAFPVLESVLEEFLSRRQSRTIQAPGQEQPLRKACLVAVETVHASAAPNRSIR